jgi:hypothetical protein
MSDAVSVVIGVLLGGSITVIKDYVASFTGRRRRGRFAAIRIICVLDQYVEKCVEVVADDGTVDGMPSGTTQSGEGFYEPQVGCPEPPSFPNDIDWTSIAPTLMYRILSLPNQAHETDRHIYARGQDARPPEYEEAFEARWEGYADLGLAALSIADELRSTFKLKKTSIAMSNPNWDSAQFLRSKKHLIDGRSDRYRAHKAAIVEAPSGYAGVAS